MTKRTKKTTPSQNRIYMLRTTLALILVALFFAVGGGIVYIGNQPSSKTYISDSMKVQFVYPTRYKVVEDTLDVLLTTDIGKISFGKSGTVYSTASDHAKYLSSTRIYTNTLLSQDINVGELTGVKLLLDLQGDKKYEYIFVKNNALYQFEANDPALFADLDTIAKSFRILD